MLSKSRALPQICCSSGRTVCQPQQPRSVAKMFQATRKSKDPIVGRRPEGGTLCYQSPTVPVTVDQEPASCQDNRNLLPVCSILSTGMKLCPGVSQELQGC